MIVIIANLLNILAFLIFLRAILSWFNLDPRNPLVVILYQVTEPILEPLRRVIPRFGMIDLTPMIAMFILFFIGRLLLGGI